MQVTPVTKKDRVLVVDDEKNIRWVLGNLLTEKGFEVVEAKDGEEALKRLGEESLILAIIDIRMPGMDGLEALKRIREEVDIPVIIITAQDTTRNTIEAMKLGAFDYITKPFDLEELEIVIDRAIETHRLKREAFSLKERLREKLEREAIFVGKSPQIKRIFKTIGRVAGQDVTVLITGESGTGKELLAKVIHLNSRRAGGPFIAINSAAIPKDLIESELFGYEKGAFTGATSERPGKFELAHGGTLFLDEIGDMGLETQTKLLRVLQEREFFRLGGRRPVRVDVRVIAATNQDLRKAVSEGRFREDLFYRLNVVTIDLPPLRDRKGDIPLLVEHFLSRFEEEMGMGSKTLSPEAIDCLFQYSWPGNVRELENVLRSAYVLSPGSIILKENLPLPINKEEPSLEGLITGIIEKMVPQERRFTKGELYRIIVGGVEKTLIEVTLRHTRGNQIQAARILGINRNTLRKKIRELKIDLRK